ncbi:hypothetical protein BDV96DRAFT_347670 [Lophiotrema nucula]|uniref:RNase III domain-containing protein n=1 Tax=Lophiotrema nucula TaxID=690887 RepID=A0A6A5ZMR0_9PLEO|nr:hypothetical protein BDV96DRAFT_347670 [Lophiotrema nucula]
MCRRSNVAQLTMPSTSIGYDEVGVARCEQILQYHFKNKFLCIEAISTIKRSIKMNDGQSVEVQDNLAMAVLGYTQMASVLCRIWWETGRRKRGERVAGDLDIVVKAKLNNKALGRLGKEMDIHRYIINTSAPFSCFTGDSEAKDKVVAETMRAIFGAVYLDGRGDELEQTMRRLKFDQHELLEVKVPRFGHGKI